MKKQLTHLEEEALEMLLIAAVREIQDNHQVNLSFTYNKGLLSRFHYYLRNKA